LHDQIVRLAIAIRPVGAETRNTAPDQPRIAGRVVPQAQALHGARSQIVHEHVGLCYQFVQRAAAFLQLHVEGDAPLAAVQPGEVARDAVQRVIVPTREIAAVRPLDLDHVGPHVG
jgi:hypothetical protein